ncbi:MAG: hypothetical protein MMC33_010118 [Icmadophila ericetorum]|nr:hypothetical protein [Icmadophila ericetorum]
MRPSIIRISLPLCSFARSSKSRLYSTTQPPSPPSSSLSPLVISRTVAAPHCGNIRILSLNNPKSRNAISRALLAQLRGYVEEIAGEGEKGDTRAVVLASEVDEAFCAGADLKERREMSMEETNQFLSSLRSTLTILSELPIPTFTSLSSLALGGGLELALATTFRIFASTAVVGLPETRLAIIPGAGGTYRLPAVVGRQRALDLLLTGRRIGGNEAQKMGLCDRVLDVQDLQSRKKEVAQLEAKELRELTLKCALEMVKEVCEGGPGAVRAVLRAVRGAEKEEGRWVSGEKSENREYESVLKSEDRNEALRAFKEKRKPNFRGR